MNKNQKTIIIKRVCAVLLLISFFLPVARGCSKYELSQQEDSVKQEKKKPLFHFEEKEAKKKYVYDFLVLEETHISSALLFLLFGYLWPIPFLLSHYFVKRKIFKKILSFIELMLCLGTINLIIIFAAFEAELLSGGYLAIASVSVYFCVSAFELFKWIHAYFKERKG